MQRELYSVIRNSIGGGGSIVRPFPIEQAEFYVGKGYEIDPTELTCEYDELIYLGHIYNHWGHFLIDFCTRLYYAYKYGKQSKCAFIVREHQTLDLIPNIKRFIELLDIDVNNVVFISEVSKCKRLIIPEPSYCSNVYYSNEYLEMFDTVANNAQLNDMDVHEHVYLTRSAFKVAQDKEIGEEILIDFFKKNDFYMVAPEKLSLDEQISIMRRSSVVAGISGTVTHNFLFAKPNFNQKFIIVNKTYVMNMMQLDINQIRGLRVDYIDAYLSPLPVSIGLGPFLFAFTDVFHDYATDNHLITPDDCLANKKHEEMNLKKYLHFYRKILGKSYKVLPYVNCETSVHYFGECFSRAFITLYFNEHPVRFYETFSFRDLLRKVSRLFKH